MSSPRWFAPCATIVALAPLSGCEEGPLAPEIEPARQATVFPAPSNLTAIATSAVQVNLTWSDNSGDELGFEIYQSITGLTAFTLAATTPANVTQASFAGLEPEREYCYQVRAFKRTFKGKSGSYVYTYSAFSPASCVTTPVLTVPEAPSGVEVRVEPPDFAPWYLAERGMSVRTEWHVGAGVAAGFRVEQSTVGGSWTLVGTTSGTDTYLDDFAPPRELPACYRVIAYNAAGDSPPSNAACVTVPADPSDLVATYDEGTWIVHLTWSDNSAVETGYELYTMDEYGFLIWVATLPPNTTSYTPTPLAGGWQYQLITLAENAYSNWVAVSVF